MGRVVSPRQVEITSDLLRAYAIQGQAAEGWEVITLGLSDAETQELVDAAGDADTDATRANRRELVRRALAALDANAADIAQDDTIQSQADALAATTGNFTTAQASNHIRSLARAVSLLAANDALAKRELNALIRLAIGRTRDIDGT